MPVRIEAPAAYKFQLPPGCEWAPFSHYFVDGVGRASVDFDVTEYYESQEAISIVEVVVDYSNGNDANAGTTRAPFKTLNHAISTVGNVGVIWLKDGVHYLTTTEVIDATFGKPAVSLKSLSGSEVTVRIGPDPATTSYAVSSGTSNTYEASVSAAFAVFDTSITDSRGRYTPLIQRTSKTEVNNNPGSFYFDGATLYVRRFTDEAPGTDLFVVANGALKVTDNVALYLENVRVEGGNTVQAVALNGNKPRFYMKGGALAYGNNFGLDADGADCFIENTEAFLNGLDNFNYHVESGLECNAIEINVNSSGAGAVKKVAPENKNGSSMHDGGNIIRINGQYEGNYGPNVIDTTTGTAVNIGTEARASIAPTANQNRNFAIGATGFIGTGYCHFTRSRGSVTDYSAEGGGSVMNLAARHDGGVVSEINPGDVIRNYRPVPVL